MSGTASPELVGDGITMVRAAIIDGDFAPGQRLVEAELCARLRASRAAV